MSSNKPLSISLKPSKVKPGIAKKRPHSSLADASESEDEISNKPQLVLGFDNSVGGAIGTSKKENTAAPLIIQAPKNRDWREEAERKKGRNLLPAEEQARRAGGTKHHEAPDADVEEGQRTWGLVVIEREQSEEEDEKTPHDDPESLRAAAEKLDKKPQTADEEALAALLGAQKQDSGLVIPGSTTADERFAPRISEGDVFRADVESRPEAASLTDYTAIPVEDFGKALMRGMGWKEGMEIGRMKNKSIEDKGKKAERRAARLGIGAKELPQELAETGAWGKGAKKGAKTLTTFNPMRIRNKQTGEILTEDEFKTRQDNQKLVLTNDQDQKAESGSKAESSSRRHREDYDRDRSHRAREDDRDRDYNRRDRDKSHRRDHRREDRDEVEHRRPRERREDRDYRKDRDHREDRERRHDKDRREDWDRRNDRQGSDRYRDRR